MDVIAIQNALPHRHPFLFVDRVVSVEPGVRLVAWKNVTATEAHFAGHFPGFPVMPGVLIVEALAQAAALLCQATEPFDAAKKATYLAGLDGVRFRRPVVPGDRLELRVSLVKRRSQLWKFRGEAYVDGELAAEAELLATLADREVIVPIHPTAIVERGAELDPSCDVGPYAVIGPRVKLGARTRVGPHAVVEGDTRLGADNVVFQFASVGAVPQDLKYAGEPTRLEIGDRNTIREFATLHLGTAGGGGVTRVGDGCLLMAYSHVAHDCRVGDRVILANCASLAGHVTVGDGATLGGLAAVHQFARVGRLAFVSGGAMVTMDVPPFCSAQGDRARLTGLNTVGMARAGLDDAAVRRVKSAYRTVFRSKLPLAEAIEKVRAEHGGHAEIDDFVAFITSSERGLAR